MNCIRNAPGNGSINRRNFFAAAGAIGLTAIAGQASGAQATKEDGGGME